jgi:hypothetical protein
MVLAQPDAELTLPWSGRKDQVNGSDRVSGTHKDQPAAEPDEDEIQEAQGHE